MEKGKKGLFMGPGFFRREAGAAPQSIGCNREPADGERYGGVVWVFQLIGITVNFLPGAGCELGPGYDVSRPGMKTGFQRNLRSSGF